MSKRMVESILKLWRDTGEVVPVSHRGHKRKRIMTAEEIEVRVLFFIEYHLFTLFSFLNAWPNAIQICILTRYKAICNLSMGLLWGYQQFGKH